MVKFSIFSKFGGISPDSEIYSFERKMTKILDELTESVSSEAQLQFHIEFRVDGDFLQFGDPNGCSNLRFYKKKNLAAITIALSCDLLKSGIDIGEYIEEQFRSAIEKMIDRVMKDKIEINKPFIMEKLDSRIEKW